MALFKIMAVEISSAITEGIKNSFGCQKWSGLPYKSECLEPMEAWDCATCDQRVDAMCGVVGYIGGEVIVSYFTGGSLAVGKTMAASAAKMGSSSASKVAAKVAAKLPRLAKTTRVVVDGAKLAGSKYWQGAKWTLNNAAQSRAAQAVKKFSAKQTERVSNAASAAHGYVLARPLLNASVKLTVLPLKLAGRPIGKFLKLMDMVFVLGYLHGGLIGK
jgi:hypothetical protein